MEYVDGEDLSALLRRIGRVPQDKAIEIARQLCAGVAAAHDRGVLHRDLKPANVMLDGQGNVRITDFGIATAAADQSRELMGTPQYMAPEQLEGGAASVRSDIYALGLILFEVFTGRRAIDSRSLQDLRDFHKSGTVTSPTSIVRDLDPAVEVDVARAIVIPWMGYIAPMPSFGWTVEALNGSGDMAATWMAAISIAIQAALIYVLILVLIRLMVRRPWMTMPIAAIILALPATQQAGTTNTSLIFLFPMATGILLMFVVFRSGLLAFAIGWFVWNVTTNIPMRADWSHWSAAAGNWTMAALVALTLFGFYAARAGQTLFGSILNERSRADA